MKKLISILLVMVMALSMVAVSAYDCYPVYGKAVITDLAFTNANGAEITSVPADGTVVVSCNITKGADMYAQDAALIAAVYEGNRLLQIKADNKALSETAQGFSVTLTGVAAASSVKAFVWDGLSEAEPLSYTGILGGSNAKLWDISIDGTTIDGFSSDVTDYTVNFPASYTKVPNISALAYELSSDVNITYSYPADNTFKAVIDVTSQDGSASKTYSLTCNYKDPSLSDIIATASSGEVALSTKTAANPTFATTPSVLPSAVSTDAEKAMYMTPNLTSYCTLYKQRDFYLYNVPEYLLGEEFVYVDYGYINDTTYNSSDKALTFTLDRSATVYAVALWGWNAGYMSDWTNTGDTLGVVNVYNDRSTFDSYRTPSIYQKRFEVGETGTVDVVIEGISNKPQVVPFIVFDEVEKMDIADENSAALTGIKVDGVSVSGFMSDTYEYSLNVPESYTGSFNVVATPANADTTVTYETSEVNGNKVVTVNAVYGEDTKQYVITFVTVAAAITNAKAYTASGEVAVTFATANNPVFVTEPTVTPDAAAGKNDDTEAQYYSSNLTSSSPFYTSRAFYMYNVPAELQGAQYALNSYDYRSDATFYDVTTPAMTFDINNSATIYMTALWGVSADWVAEEGFTASDLTIDCIEMNNNNFDTFRGGLTLLKKEVEVGIGETKTVTINGLGSGKPQPVVFVVFDEKFDNSVALSDITIDGVSLASFDTATYEYTLNVPASYSGSYDVVGVPSSSSANVTYETSEVDGNKVVTINVSSGSNTKSYVITFAVGAKAITNAKAYTASGEVALNFATANNPVFVTEPTVAPADAAGKNDDTEAQYYSSNLTSSSPFYTARAFYMYNVPSELQGAQYALNSYDYRSDATFYDVTTPAMTFDINSTATIYVTGLWGVNADWVAEEGFTASDLTIDCIEMNNNNFDTFRGSLPFVSKTVEVNNIGETKTVTINGLGSGKPQPVVFIAWEE